MRYLCKVESNSSNDRMYRTDSRNVLKAANEYGRAEGGEVVTITTKTGKPVSRAIWDVSARKYQRVSIY